MKKITLINALMIMCFATQSFAQTPNSFKYQTIARNSSGTILASQHVSFRMSILQGSTSGNISYSERDTATTNQFGLANLVIGGGTLLSGGIDTINWGKSSYFLKIEFDPTGNTSYTLMGISQLLSVPYAVYAENTNGNDINFPDGIVGNAILIDSGAAYTVPVNKTLYLTPSGYDVLISGDTCFCMIIPQGTSFSNNWGYPMISGILVNAVVTSILWNTKINSSYTVPTGKNLFLNGGAGNLTVNGKIFVGSSSTNVFPSGAVITFVTNNSTYPRFPILTGYLK